MMIQREFGDSHPRSQRFPAGFGVAVTGNPGVRTPVRRPPKKFHPEPYAYHEEIEVEIDSLSNQGKGVARVDGWVVFVAFALPGERVLARVYRNDKSYSEADLIDILEASPHRREPRCELFGECGGCQYQNLDEGEQRNWKRKQLEELMRRMTGCEIDVRPVAPSPLSFHYRSKLTPHFHRPRDGAIDAIGFLKAGGRRQVVNVEQCPIATHGINERYSKLREEVFKKVGTYKKGATLLLREGLDGVETNPGAIVREKVGNVEFEFPAGDFFQNNPSILPAFVDHVTGEAKAGGANYLVDAYCGSGLFALTAAKEFSKVLGLEISEKAIEAAKKNAAHNRIGNAEFMAGDVDDLFAEVPFPAEESCVVIDPPRKGCSEKFIQQLLGYGPERFVYVSCNPATQLRDLNLFTDGGYELTLVQPFDLFPQTKHLECVMTLVAS
ncbi:MAG: class I SAM-dependent RNA methyltransferase [Verrucomicrobiota bacterium]